HVAEARWSGAVRDVHALTGLALAAVQHSPEPPLGPRADRVELRPELRRQAGVGGIAQQPSEPPALDLVRDLAAELEVEPARVDRPRAVGGHEDAAVGAGDEVFQRARVARLEAHVRHPHDRLAREALRAHAAARALEADLG